MVFEFDMVWNTPDHFIEKGDKNLSPAPSTLTDRRLRVASDAPSNLRSPHPGNESAHRIDGDSTPLTRRRPGQLRKDPGLDVFVVLEAFDNPELRPGGGTPPLLALESAASGNSFFARDGSPLGPIGFNWLIQLVLAP